MIGLLTGGSLSRTVVTLLIGAAMGGTGAWKLAESARHRMAADHMREAARAIEAARTETARYQRTADEAEQRAVIRTQAANRAAAGARSELDRLRKQLDADPSSDAAACPATAKRAAALATVQRACADALVELGRSADAHAADAVRLYEAWPMSPD